MRVTLQGDRLLCSGAWCCRDLPRALILPSVSQHIQTVFLDGTQIHKMDLTGAHRLLTYAQQLRDAGHHVELVNFRSTEFQLFDLVKSVPAAPQEPLQEFELGIVKLGRLMSGGLTKIGLFLAFIGELFICLFKGLLQPKIFFTPLVFEQLVLSGFKALAIIGLLSFLIGIVLAYQMGLQLSTYGADVFIVELTGIAILREFAPLMAAIILAGRTSSAFTAALGMMQFNAEIDLLKTLGLSPLQELVLPRVVALLIIAPLLVFWADLWGVIGSLIMSQHIASINPGSFLHRFRENVPIDNYIIGLLKAPFFAFLIATIGCFEGLQCRPTAQSIGQQTTRSVVETIFLIIIVDAIFSIVFSWLGI